MHLARSHTLFTAILACFCTKKEVILHPERLSYTLSYTRKRLQIQDVWGMGVGNVGFYSKTFFVERGREKEHIAPEVTKHRTSLGKSTDVLHRKYGCLPQRSPMFLFSEKGSGQRVPILEEENTPSMEGVEYGKTGTGNVAPDRYPLCPGCSTQGIGLDAGEATLSEGTDVNPLVGSGEKHGLAGLQRGGVSF